MDDRFTSEAGRFEWVKPDLSRGSSWHLARVYNLVDAAKGCETANSSSSRDSLILKSIGPMTGPTEFSNCERTG